MIKVLFSSLVATTLTLNLAYAQKLLYGFGGNVKNISVVSIGDTLFYRYQEKSGNKEIKSMWITDAGTVPVSIMQDVAAGVRNGNEIYLYHTTEVNKITSVNAEVIDGTTGEHHPADATINVDGTILSVFTDNKILYFVSMNATGTVLSIKEIDRMKDVRTVSYKLPQSISSYVSETSPLELFVNGSGVNAFKGKSKAKLYKYGSRFYLTIENMSTLVTHIMALEPDTQSVRETKVAALTTKFDMNSFFLDDKLFQMTIDRNRIIVTIYDATSGNLLAQKVLFGDEPGFPAYFRNGRKSVVGADDESSNIVKFATQSKVVFNVVKKEGQYVMQVGTYYDLNGGGVVIVSPLSLAGIFASALTTAIIQSIDSPGMTRYFYYSWDGASKTINVKDAALLTTKEKIDRYEVANYKKGINYKFKTYIGHKDGVIGTYFNAGRDDIASVVYFE